MNNLRIFKNITIFHNFAFICMVLAAIGALLSNNMSALIAWLSALLLFVMFRKERSQNIWLLQSIEAEREQKIKGSIDHSDHKTNSVDNN